MLMNVTGVRENSGEFNGVAYRNVTFSGTTDPITEDGAGYEVGEAKVRGKLITKALGKEPTLADIVNLIGSTIDYEHGSDGKIFRFQITERPDVKPAPAPLPAPKSTK
jgi:hypothetical protein